MLQADLSGSSLAECLAAVLRVIDRRGIDSQHGTRAVRIRDYRFARTNIGSTQLWVGPHLCLSVPLADSSEGLVWNPGDWVREIDQIDQEVARETL